MGSKTANARNQQRSTETKRDPRLIYGLNRAFVSCFSCTKDPYAKKRDQFMHEDSLIPLLGLLNAFLWFWVPFLFCLTFQFLRELFGLLDSHYPRYGLNETRTRLVRRFKTVWQNFSIWMLYKAVSCQCHLLQVVGHESKSKVFTYLDYVEQ